jgi:hypothetical protein
MRKLTDVFLIGFTIMFVIIGIDQTLFLGFNHGYWAFMLALITFFVFTYRKSRKPASPSQSASKEIKKRKSKR